MTFITPAYVRQRLDYNKETGVFRWNAKPVECIADNVWNSNKSGKVAGSKQSDGQWFIFLNGEPIPAQWLAYTHVVGKRPNDDVVHLNGDVSDNRYSNLRVYTGVEPSPPILKKAVSAPKPVKKKTIKPIRPPEMLKKRNPLIPKSGCVGVHYLTQKQKWAAHPRKDGKVLHLGYYHDVADAIAAVTAYHAGLPIVRPVYKRVKFDRPKAPVAKIVRSDNLTPDQIAKVRSLYRYDAITGQITREYGGGWKAVGHTDGISRAYISWGKIKIRYEVFAWILTHGRNPIGGIIHRDSDLLNNKLNNLIEGCLVRRRSSPLTNLDTARVNNKSGCIGVMHLPQSNRWTGRVNYNKKRYHLGTFATYEEAANAVRECRLSLSSW